MSQGTTQITVAVISVAGVIAAAVIANYDKLFGDARVPAAAVAQPSPAPSVATAPPPAASPEGVVKAQADALGAITTALDGVGATIEAGSVADISGQWRDADGYTYTVAQKGGDYSYQQFQNGAQVGGGQGAIAGRTMRHGFASIYGPGECVGEVAADGGSIGGLCGNGETSWPFRITR